MRVLTRQIEDLIDSFELLDHLCEEMIATLSISANKKHFDNIPGFHEMVDRWRRQYKEVTQDQHMLKKIEEDHYDQMEQRHMSKKGRYY